MSKKDDLLERMAHAPGEAARPIRQENPGVPSRAESVTTRVSRRVVRRRRREEPAPVPPPVQAAPEPVAPTPDPVVEEPREPTAEVPREPTAEVPREPTAEVSPAPVAAAPPEPAEPEVPREPTAEAPAPAPTTEPAPVAEPAVAAAPAPVVEAEPVAAAPAPAPAPVPPGQTDHGGKFAGLGKAVVMPPPGYDPTNPLAYRREQEQQAQAQAKAKADPAAAAKKPPRGRRRVEHGHRPDPGANRGGRRRGRGFDSPVRRRRKTSGPKAASPAPKGAKRKVRVDNVISVGQLAHQLSVKPAVVIRVLMDVGEMVNITAMLDMETATIVASEFDYEVENVGFVEEHFLQKVEEEEDVGQALSRPPVVTIMGHVDHGKTTLLDAIRSSRVAQGEAGGITQHIGAYQVQIGDDSITFIDTPGHQAFTAMRARGAQVTDLVILVVAADDGVQPQTEEAIAHAKAADVPIIVAVNKMDKPGVTAESTKQRLSEHGLQAEDWGGDTMFVPVSALKGQGIEDLLEAIHLQAEMLDLKANPDRHAEGMVIEAQMERGRGAVATVLVQRGTLRRGDYVVLGSAFGKVRALVDFKGDRLKAAGPSTPVEIFGLSGLPEVGDEVAVVKNEKNARKLADHRGRQKREAAMANTRRRTAEDIFAAANAEQRETLLLIVKADVQGTLQALRGALEAVDVGGAEIRILHAAVGPISESDVNLAAANGATLIGFNCNVDAKARSAAQQQGVVPELYSVIYDVLDRVEGALKGLLAPVYEQVRRGSVEVRVLYRISRVGTVAGSYVLDGTVGRNHIVKVLRGNKTVWEGKISALKRFKDDVKEVAAGYECGVSLDGFNDLEEGDIIESFSTEQVERA